MTSARIPLQVPIAVVGIAAFMPGSTDLGGFWRTVLTGRDLMTDVPASRWLIDDYYDRTRGPRTRPMAGGAVTESLHAEVLGVGLVRVFAGPYA
jgi:acyl transferase domain-containing protein